MELSVIGLVSVITIILVLFSFFNEKILKLPSEIGLMTIAFALSLILLIMQYFGVPIVSSAVSVIYLFNVHDIIMNGLICFLLFSGSAKIKLRDLTHDKYLITSLAFFSTLIAAIAYGTLAYLFAKFIGLDMTFIQACMLGSIIAPTDPISAMSILKKAGLSRRISMIIEGESLFNDGIAVALFVTFSEINKHIAGTSPWMTFFETILVSVFGAIAIGLIVCIPLFAFFKYTKQKHLEIIISFAAVTSAYALSEKLGVSAPIAAVVVGIFFATKMNMLHDDYEDYYTNFYSFWKVIDKTLNGMLYIIIGFAILFLHSMPYFLSIMIAAVVIGFISRLISLITPVYLFSRNAGVHPYAKSYPLAVKRKNVKAMIKLLTWGGLKGGICIALALGTGNYVSETIYNYIVVSTYAVVAFSILVQGLTIKRVYAKIVCDFSE